MVANGEISLQIAINFEWGILRDTSVLKSLLKPIIFFVTGDIYLLVVFWSVTAKFTGLAGRRK